MQNAGLATNYYSACRLIRTQMYPNDLCGYESRKCFYLIIPKVGKVKKKIGAKVSFNGLSLYPLLLHLLLLLLLLMQTPELDSEVAEGGLRARG